ncbi:unnamed protein product [Protopolystoma xenopodis]|uniref:Protein sleepless n=1 Tax=Protopolystoma xenopodis TaxID=117903 RepID=A0A3S5AX92_9PLAT|nr:unnamed protein product [Protopolystoma xenopodis]
MQLRRYCDLQGGEPDELTCTRQQSQGGFSEVCICGTNNCNTATRLPVQMAGPGLGVLAGLLAGLLASK